MAVLMRGGEDPPTHNRLWIQEKWVQILTREESVRKTILGTEEWQGLKASEELASMPYLGKGKRASLSQFLLFSFKFVEHTGYATGSTRRVTRTLPPSGTYNPVGSRRGGPSKYMMYVSRVMPLAENVERSQT